jgi:hypothetical protein
MSLTYPIKLEPDDNGTLDAAFRALGHRCFRPAGAARRSPQIQPAQFLRVDAAASSAVWIFQRVVSSSGTSTAPSPKSDSGCTILSASSEDFLLPMPCNVRSSLRLRERASKRTKTLLGYM